MTTNHTTHGNRTHGDYPLYALASQLNRLRTPEEIAVVLATETRGLLRYDRCLVFLLEDERHILAAIEGDYTAEQRAAYRDYAMPRGTGLLWHAIERGETLAVPDLARDARVVATVRTPRVGEAALIVPLIHEEHALGVLFLTRDGVPYTTSDAHAMNVLAAHAATAIHDARQHEEAQRRVRELESLQRAVAIVGANLDRAATLTAIVEALADVFGYHHVSMYLREGDELLLQAQVGYDFYFERLTLARGVIARCVREGRAILLPNVADDPEYMEAAAGVRSEVAVPIFVLGVAVGALNVESGLERQLGQWDLALIELFSQQVGVALANVTRYEEAVERATVDPVTGLPNHRSLMERLTAAVADARAHGTPLALLFFDLDRFKLVNDAFGHRFGDDVLAGLGSFLREHLPAQAELARYGGEEFAALLPATTLTAATLIAEQARTALATRTLPTPSGHDVALTVSIGVAGLPETNVTSAEALIDAADLAMYAAKRLGRNQVVCWTPELGQHPSPRA